MAWACSILLKRHNETNKTTCFAPFNSALICSALATKLQSGHLGGGRAGGGASAAARTLIIRKRNFLRQRLKRLRKSLLVFLQKTPKKLGKRHNEK